MIRKTNQNKTAVIILHEIYGVNRFMEETCSEYHSWGFDVFCPDLLHRECFPYAEVSEAYHFFMNHVGFDYCKDVECLIAQLKHRYHKVFVIGFSVGATIAWRCCESAECDGIICCYGSRIRDYLSLQPRCPALLLFAEHDSFDVENIITQLLQKSNVELYKLHADHGFMDQYSNYFSREQAQLSEEYIKSFLKRHME